MTIRTLSLLVGMWVALFRLSAQPIMENRFVYLDFDGDQFNDMRLTIFSMETLGPVPQQWSVDADVTAKSGAVFLKPTKAREDFSKGEVVGDVGDIALAPDAGIGLISYLAESRVPSDPSFWTYQTGIEYPVIDRAEFHLGLRIKVEGENHYAWVKFSRPVVDNHTMFEIAGHDWNPIPDAPIPAGEPPGPPPLLAAVGDDGGLNVTWDNRLGEMVLEWSDRLTAEASWQPVPESGFPPVHVSLGDGNRFFRLRRP